MEDYFAHQSAFIDEGANVGKGARIWHNTHVTETAIIGEKSNVGQNCFVAGKVGNNCKLQNNVNVYQGVKLGNYVFCGPSMTFTNDKSPRAQFPKNGEYLATTVGNNVTFGAGSVILSNISIGDWAFIGAGAVVTKDVLDYALIVGNPGKQIGWACECGLSLGNMHDSVVCNNCGKTYQLNDKKELKRV